MTQEYTKHPRIDERAVQGPHLTRDEHIGINGKIAVWITNSVSTMWCAYLFALISLISLPGAIRGGLYEILTWLTQTFLQLVLLSVIMVGQKVLSRTSDKRATQAFKDTEALLELQDEVRRQIEINNELTREIHNEILKK